MDQWLIFADFFYKSEGVTHKSNQLDGLTNCKSIRYMNFVIFK